MSQFMPVAQSRARYYCKGSPVQFVMVELLRMEETGHMVVTLTFKNVHSQPLTSFTAHFRCKDAKGEILVEDDFLYENLSVGEGELFGADDAVFVSEQPLGSVEVSLVSVEYGVGRVHSLTQCTPMGLPAVQKLPADVAARIDAHLGKKVAAVLPANVADGWVCTCGAFNYNAGQGAVLCTECGTDKAVLLSAVRAAVQPGAAPAAPVAPQSPNIQRAQRNLDMEKTRVLPTATRAMEQDTQSTARVMPRAAAANAVSIMQPTTADFILRWAPVITAGMCLIYVMGALLVHYIIG